MKDKSLGYSKDAAKPIAKAPAPKGSAGWGLGGAVKHLNSTVKGNQGGIHKVTGCGKNR